MRTKTKCVYIFGIKRKSVSQKEIKKYKYKDEFLDSVEEFRNDLVQLYKDSGLDVPEKFEYIDNDLFLLRKDIYGIYEHKWDCDENVYLHDAIKRACENIHIFA